MAIANKVRGRKLVNRARPTPATENTASNIARKEDELRRFNPDYDMVIKRISRSVNGLRCGSPPGIVT